MSRVTGILADEEEFVQIIKGLIRDDLAPYILSSRFITHDGKSYVAIPIHSIDIPTFRFGFPNDYVVGQGEGEQGDDLGPVHDPDDEGEKGEGSEGTGSKITIIVDEEEFFEWFEEYLQLPRIQPKGERTIYEIREKYNTIHKIGSRSMMNRRRTFLEAVKRSIASGEYVPPDKQNVSVFPPDMRFLSSQMVKEPRNNAVLFFMRDVSGSMGQDEAEALSILCSYCERWLHASYKKGSFDAVYVVHDGEAQEVQRNQFLATMSYGGTLASSAHELMLKIIDERYSPNYWNIYVFYFSDGFNWTQDNLKYTELLEGKILPIVNQYNYGETHLIRSWYYAYQQSNANTFSTPGTIGEILTKAFRKFPNLAVAKVTGKDTASIIKTIRAFFEKGN